mmetsp:Transcript_17280/g.26651  ORF Transcript_17280/g.26651 Transcript_17280/m.26651 type:complete len:202 (-) Transcript_17280:18-623(-)
MTSTWHPMTTKQGCQTLSKLTLKKRTMNKCSRRSTKLTSEQPWLPSSKLRLMSRGTQAGLFLLLEERQAPVITIHMLELACRPLLSLHSEDSRLMEVLLLQRIGTAVVREAKEVMVVKVCLVEVAKLCLTKEDKACPMAGTSSSSSTSSSNLLKLPMDKHPSVDNLCPLSTETRPTTSSSTVCLQADSHLAESKPQTAVRN